MPLDYHRIGLRGLLLVAILGILGGVAGFRNGWMMGPPLLASAVAFWALARLSRKQ